MSSPEGEPQPFVTASSWFSAEPPEGQRAAWHRLAAALRQINEALMDMDAAEEDLDRAAANAATFAASLEQTRRGHQHWGFGETSVSGAPRAMHDRSPLIGLGNPIAPPLSFVVEGDRVVGSGSFGLQYEGPPGHVHGGFIAAAFDEVLGMAQSLSGKGGMTGTLTIRYRKPTPLHTQLRFEAKVERVEGRKIFTSATLHAGETFCAEAEGIFISVDFAAMAERRAGSPGGS